MKRLILIIRIGLIALVMHMVASCKQNDSASTVTCGGTEISFSKEVSPIMVSSCATNSACHATGSTRGPGPLTTYAQIYSARSSIRSSVANGSMPEGSSLTATQKNIIICWINNGATNN